MATSRYGFAFFRKFSIMVSISACDLPDIEFMTSAASPLSGRQHLHLKITRSSIVADLPSV